MPHHRLSESESLRILERAIQLDASSSSRMSLDQLRSVGEELGLATDAIERAITESEAAGRRHSRAPGAAARSPWRTALPGLAGGLAGGAMVRLWPNPIFVMGADTPVLIALAAVGLACLGFIARYRERRDGWKLQALLLGLWSGFATGLTVVGERPALDVLQLCAGGWAVSAVAAIVGTLVSSLYRSDSLETNSPARGST
jgi:hypothetical protein